MRWAIKILRDEEAATAVEYAVMLGLILAAVVAVIGTVGTQAGGMWGNVDTKLDDAGFGR